ncbi:MAG: hypothetical protein IPF99_35440 [Deltaproteobacteria bacterium]|nr:hypothetical protein [Deltaproteobacteria bacterium]
MQPREQAPMPGRQSRPLGQGIEALQPKQMPPGGERWQVVDAHPASVRHCTGHARGARRVGALAASVRGGGARGASVLTPPSSAVPASVLAPPSSAALASPSGASSIAAASASAGASRPPPASAGGSLAPGHPGVAKRNARATKRRRAWLGIARG